MEQILEDIKNGDKDAFTNFILGNEQKYYKIAKIIINSDDDIADSIQNTLIYAYKNIKKIKNMSYFNTWIIRILINECKKTYNRNKKINYISNEVEIVDENSHIQKENSEFYLIINHLDYKDKQIFTLYYVYGLTTKEIRKNIKNK